MPLSDEQVASFQRLYQQHYGVELTKAEATERGQQLTQLLKAVYVDKLSTNQSN